MLSTGCVGNNKNIHNETKNKPIIFIEIAPYLYPEFGYSCRDLIEFIKELNYSFLDENLKDVPNIFDRIKKIEDGSSTNFFLV